jgi:hypothetical protein
MMEVCHQCASVLVNIDSGGWSYDILKIFNE